MKAYKFYSEPNKLVSDGNTGLPILEFDENGEYVTLDLMLAKRMKPHFENKEIELIEKGTEKPEKEPEQELKEFHCKKCDFVTDNRGSLMAHYRENHPKEG